MNLKKAVRTFARRVLHRVGLDVTAYSAMRNHELRRAALIRDRAIGLVMDGGAHKGEYASTLRQLGYEGQILSVEPLPGPFAQLKRRAARDSQWRCVNSALGMESGRTTIHANPISEVSSLLPATGMVNTQGWQATRPLTVGVRTIDSLLADYFWNGALYIKLDVQGYEMQVLSGAEDAVRRASAIELELSTVELYRGSVLFPDAVWQLHRLGFSIYSMEPVLVDHLSARVLQLDCIFVNDEGAGPPT